jgi:hypothetical protein
LKHQNGRKEGRCIQLVYLFLHSTQGPAENNSTAQYMSRNNETRFLSGKLRLHMQAMFNTFSLPNVLEIPRSDKTTSTNIDVSLSKPKPSKTKSTNNLTLVHWQKNMDELFTTCTPAIYILYK